jgi:ubiquinone/menaquinone biosynthesis C-methylase UbiE
MKRLPFSESRFAKNFDSEERAQEYVKSHSGWARKAGEIFAAELRKLGCQPQRILDAGAGSGDTAAVLAEAFPEAEVTGLDLSEHMLAVAKQRIADAGLADRVRFIQGDVAEMPLRSGMFDAVVSQDTLHLLDEPLPMLNECERVRAEHGALVLRSVRRSWLGLLDPIFRTGYTVTELADLCRRSTIQHWRIKANLMYLMLTAGGGG